MVPGAKIVGRTQIEWRLFFDSEVWRDVRHEQEFSSLYAPWVVAVAASSSLLKFLRLPPGKSISYALRVVTVLACGSIKVALHSGPTDRSKSSWRRSMAPSRVLLVAEV